MELDDVRQTLSDEMLEHIVGGLSGKDMQLIDNTIATLKGGGLPLDYVLEVYSLIRDPALKQEALDYVTANWDRF